MTKRWVVIEAAIPVWADTNDDAETAAVDKAEAALRAAGIEAEWIEAMGTMEHPA